MTATHAPLALIALAIAATPAAAHETVLRGRLVFADHKDAVVRVLDLDTGDVGPSIPVPKPNPVLQSVGDGRYVVIRTGDDAGTVRILDSGLLREPHGDHVDIDKVPVRLLDLALTGDRPVHVVSGHNWMSVYYDGYQPWVRPSTSRAELIDLASLDRAAPERKTWTSSAPQHGIAVPLGGANWILTTPNPAYAKGDDKTASSRPNVLDVRDGAANWAVRASYDCRLMHGHAEIGASHLFGCADGVAVIDFAKKPAGDGRKLAYPDDRVTSAMATRDGAGLAVGNYGKSGPFTAFLRIDPKAKALAAADVFEIPEGQATCQFALAPGGRRLVHLAGDGKLRVYDVAPAWKEVARFDAVPAFDCGSAAQTPAARLALVGDSAFVTDPTNGRIREFHLNTLQQGLDFDVGGMPSNVASDG